MLSSSKLVSQSFILYLCAFGAFASTAQKDYYITATVEVTLKEVVTITLDIAGSSFTGPTSTSASSTPVPSSYELSSGPASHSASPSLPHSAPSSTLSSGQSSSSAYVFDPQSKRNVAVYFGQTAATSKTSLATLCADRNIDIAILAFVVSRNDSGGPYPRVNFGAACGGQTPLMVQKAPGLLSCPELAADIETCQKVYGKKVLLSIGGSSGSIMFNTKSEASAFGGIIWDLFGPQGKIDLDLRPFGSVSIDGFDIDNEDNQNMYYEVLGSTLRGLYSEITGMEFYLSAAPQCPNPDASDPTTLLLLCDFVWVQFYNNPPCSIGTLGFAASLQSWSSTLSPSKARLYLGAPAWSGADETTYEKIGTASGMEAIVQKVAQMGLANFGGVMFWDGSEGLQNQVDGKDIIAWAKSGL